VVQKLALIKYEVMQ